MEQDKYVKWKHVEELIKLINFRDSFMDWTDEYEKNDKKVKSTVEWLERNAKEIDIGVTFMMEDRKTTLLKACRDLLRKQNHSPYVLNLLNETIFYDEANCDGHCLLDDIEIELGES